MNRIIRNLIFFEGAKKSGSRLRSNSNILRARPKAESRSLFGLLALALCLALTCGWTRDSWTRLTAGLCFLGKELFP